MSKSKYFFENKEIAQNLEKLICKIKNDVDASKRFALLFEKGNENAIDAISLLLKNCDEDAINSLSVLFKKCDNRTIDGLSIIFSNIGVDGSIVSKFALLFKNIKGAVTGSVILCLVDMIRILDNESAKGLVLMLSNFDDETAQKFVKLLWNIKRFNARLAMNLINLLKEIGNNINSQSYATGLMWLIESLDDFSIQGFMLLLKNVKKEYVKNFAHFLGEMAKNKKTISNFAQLLGAREDVPGDHNRFKPLFDNYVAQDLVQNLFEEKQQQSNVNKIINKIAEENFNPKEFISSGFGANKEQLPETVV